MPISHVEPRKKQTWVFYQGWKISHPPFWFWDNAFLENAYEKKSHKKSPTFRSKKYGTSCFYRFFSVFKYFWFLPYVNLCLQSFCSIIFIIAFVFPLVVLAFSLLHVVKVGKRILTVLKIFFMLQYK